MAQPGLQISVAGMLGLVACVAVNIWLFRVGLLYGAVGLIVTKHVAVAVLCQTLGVNRRGPDGPDQAAEPRRHASLNGTP